MFPSKVGSENQFKYIYQAVNYLEALGALLDRMTKHIHFALGKHADDSTIHNKGCLQE